MKACIWWKTWARVFSKSTKREMGWSSTEVFNCKVFTLGKLLRISVTRSCFWRLVMAMFMSSDCSFWSSNVTMTAGTEHRRLSLSVLSVSAERVPGWQQSKSSWTATLVRRDGTLDDDDDDDDLRALVEETSWFSGITSWCSGIDGGTRRVLGELEGGDGDGCSSVACLGEVSYVGSDPNSTSEC